MTSSEDCGLKELHAKESALRQKRRPNLVLQPRFILIEKTPRTREHVYTADFMYIEDGQTIVEDVKGAVTTDYALRRDMFLVRYPYITFRENRIGIIRDY